MKRLCKLLAFLSIFVACAEQPSGFGTGNQGGEANDVGSILGFDPTTGNDVPNQPANTTSSSAGAAVAFAVAKGDRRRVEEFYTGLWISGIINQNPI